MQPASLPDGEDLPQPSGGDREQGLLELLGDTLGGLVAGIAGATGRVFPVRAPDWMKTDSAVPVRVICAPVVGRRRQMRAPDSSDRRSTSTSYQVPRWSTRASTTPITGANRSGWVTRE